MIFFAVINRDLVFLLRFPFLSHIQVFLFAILLVYLLKHPYSCFSFHFCFLAFVVFLLALMMSLLQLAAMFNLSLLFLIYSSNFLIPDIGMMVRVFTNGLGDLGSTPGRIIPKTQKSYLMAPLLNTQQYKVGIKGKVEQSRKSSSSLPYTSV